MNFLNHILSVSLIAGSFAVPAIAQEAPAQIDESSKLIAQAPGASAAVEVGKRPAFTRLTEDQLEKMHALRTAYKNSVGAKRAELQVQKRALKDTLSATAVDRAKAVAIQGQINAIQNDLANARLALKIDGLNVLTAEQRAQMHSMMLRRGMSFGKKGGHKSFHGKRHGRGHGGGFGGHKGGR